MKIYTGNPCGSVDKIQKLINYDIGVMLSTGPSSRCIKALVQAGIPVALDNGAFQAWKRGFPFMADLFWELLKKAYLEQANIDFLVCPDIVAGGRDSLDFSLEWAKKLTGCNRLALAVQDGMDTDDIRSYERRRFGWIFIGGTVEWKWKNAEQWVEFAHTHGMKCHIGRVGTVDKLRYAKSIGADSIDSTSFIRNDSWQLLDDFKAEPQQITLNLSGASCAKELPKKDNAEAQNTTANGISMVAGTRKSGTTSPC